MQSVSGAVLRETRRGTAPQSEVWPQTGPPDEIFDKCIWTNEMNK